MSSGGSKKLKQSRGPGFVCVFCDKYFTGTCIESIHIRRHIHEKPYNCQFCDYSAVCASDVGLHERKVHKSGAAYKCSKCTKTFKLLVYLENHLRTHQESQMACQESVDVKVEVKEEDLEEMEASTSFPPPPKRIRKRTWTPEQMERRRVWRREQYRKKKFEEQKLHPPPLVKKELLPLTEEELEKQKDRRLKRAESERKRVARIRQEDPERFEEMLKRKRKKKVEVRPLTEEELEKQERRRRLNREQNMRDRERKKKEDPEGYKEMIRQKNERAALKKATMTEEELKQYKLKMLLQRHAYSRQKGRWRDRSVEEKRKQREAHKNWVKNLTEEKKKRYQESLRRAHYKMIEKWKAEDPAKWESFREMQKARLRERYANETPEEREWRRRKEKVNAARRRQKKQLENEGVGEEEIQKRDEELKVRMWKEFDPEGEMPGSRTRRKRGRPPKYANFTPSQNQTENEEWFGGDDYFASSPPPSPCSSPMPPTSVTSSFPEPPTTTKVETDSRYDSSTEEFQCSHCSSTFQDENERRIHIQLIHPASCWKCPKCDEMVLSSAELSQHYNAAHKPVPSETIKDLEKNSPKDKEKSPFAFQCMRCPYSPPKAQKPDENSKGKFKTKPELLSHVKKTHPGSYWPCKDCHLLKYSEQSLQIHLNYCRLHHANKINGEI